MCWPRWGDADASIADVSAIGPLERWTRSQNVFWRRMLGNSCQNNFIERARKEEFNAFVQLPWPGHGGGGPRGAQDCTAKPSATQTPRLLICMMSVYGPGEERNHCRCICPRCCCACRRTCRGLKPPPKKTKQAGVLAHYEPVEYNSQPLLNLLGNLIPFDRRSQKSF